MATPVSQDLTIQAGEVRTFVQNTDYSYMAALLVGLWNGTVDEVYYEPTVINYGEMHLDDAGYGTGQLLLFNSNLFWEYGVTKNYGLMSAVVPAAYTVRALYSPSGSAGPDIFNYGTILAQARDDSIGYESWEPGAVFVNGPEALVSARGAERARALYFPNGGSVTNDGQLIAEVTGGGHPLTPDAATAIEFGYGGFFAESSLVNTDLIEAAGADPEHWVDAILIRGETRLSIVNSGTIRGANAIAQTDSGTTGSVSIENEGSIEGEVILGLGNDRFVNLNRMAGSVDLGGGDDLYDGASGTVSGPVRGGDGGDRLTSGAGDEQLFGDDGDDSLDGGGGADRLEGGAGADVFAFREAADSTAEARDRIVDFESGVDKIDLTALGTVSLGWQQVTDEEGTYTLVTAVAVAGTLTLRVDSGQPLQQSDFVAPIGPTEGDDQLYGTNQADLVDGLGGNDRIDGGLGADRLFGGSGDDTIQFSAVQIVSPAPPPGAIEGGAGFDTLDLRQVAPAGVGSGAGGLVAWVGSQGFAVTGIERILLGAADDLAFLPSDRADPLEIRAGAGNDILHGSGAYLLHGEAGDDEFFISATFSEPRLGAVHGGEGRDLLKTNISFTVDLAAGTAQAYNASYAISGIEDVAVSLSGYASRVAGDGVANRFSVLSYGDDGAAGIVFEGRGGDDQLTGGAGDDSLDGGAGADTMAGGAGDDAYVVDEAGDVVTEAPGGGTDTVRSAIGYTLGANVENLVLTGPNPIGGTGNALANSLTGNAAANALNGLEGDDLLNGAGGADTMAGGLGHDIYVADHAGDKAVESDPAGGTDRVESSVSFTLGAHVEHLTLTGASAVNGTGNGLVNKLNGNGAANVLNGLAGADIMAGGLGDDIYVVDQSGESVSEAAGAGIDRVESAVAYTLGANLENLTLTGLGSVNATGNGLANSLVGNGSANRLDGGAGADVMAGGLGFDVYVVDHVGDQVAETDPAGGRDTVRSSIGFALGANVENLVLTGPNAINGAGNALANALTGNAASNRLDGGAGADTMEGNAGDDIYVVDQSGDRVVETSAAGGKDKVESSIGFSLVAHVENLTLTGSAAIDGLGNALANILTGNGAANLLNGAGAADTMAGMGGDDIYVVDHLLDKAVESAGQGSDTVQSSASFILGENVEHLTLTGAGALDGTGNGLANSLTGNAGANKLRGEGGADTLIGGAASDRLYGGPGNDVLTGGAGNDGFWFDTAPAAGNADQITDFSAPDDAIHLSRATFTGLGPAGPLAGTAFQAGPAALDPTDRILYDAATGNLFHDADGSGGAAAILFATVQPGTILTHLDFIVF